MGNGDVSAFIRIIRATCIEEDLLGGHVVAVEHGGEGLSLLRHAMSAPDLLAFSKSVLIVLELCMRELVARGGDSGSTFSDSKRNTDMGGEVGDVARALLRAHGRRGFLSPYYSSVGWSPACVGSPRQGYRRVSPAPTAL